MGIFIRRRLAMGWLPDYPDFRDLTVENDHVSTRLQGLGQKDSIKEMLTKTGASKSGKKILPKRPNGFRLSKIRAIWVLVLLMQGLGWSNILNGVLLENTLMHQDYSYIKPRVT